MQNGSDCHGALASHGSLALMALGPSRARRLWTGTALAAIAVLTSIGLFSAVGLVGRAVVF